jgi:hypothetical protein
VDDGDSLNDEDDLDPAQAEREILAFIESAEDLQGPRVADLVSSAVDALHTASEKIRHDTEDLSTNKLIATMLATGSEARRLGADDPRHWELLAASILLSGLIGPRAAADRA